MTKILSFVFAADFAVSANSQTLLDENFNSYNTGNLGSQGGWSRDGGANNMAKIATIDAAHGKSLQLASTAANATGMWIYKEFNYGLATEGNDLFVGEFEMYTGSSFAEIQVYESDGSSFYAIYDIYMDPTNGAYLADQADFDNETSGELLTTNIAANTWYKVKVTYNIQDGTMNVSINDVNYGPFQKEAYHYPTEFDVVTSGVNNSGYDNIKMSAEPLLAVNNVNKTKVNVYPNPTTEVLNIASDKKVSNVTFFDATGRKVKQATDNVINVEGLAKGNYIVNIEFADGSKESRKVIKK